MQCRGTVPRSPLGGMLTIGKNCQIQQTSSQFSRDGGSQFSTIAMVMVKR